MTEDEVRVIVAEMLGMADGGEGVSLCSFQGNVSMKAIGEMVRNAGMGSKYVLLDLSGVRSIGGSKPYWRG